MPSVAAQSRPVQDVVIAPLRSCLSSHIRERPNGGQIGSNECVLQSFQGSDERRCLSVGSVQIIESTRRKVERLHGTGARPRNVQQRTKQSGVSEFLSQ